MPQAVSASDAASSSSDSDDTLRSRDEPLYKVDVMIPVVDYRLRFDIPRIPYQDEIVRTADWIDTKIPTIKGRPAIRECMSNLKPGVTVALVSLPLSISLAIAADALPVQGCITAVWAGLSAAVLGGSHYNIVGPTGALSGILSMYSLKYCKPGEVCYTGVLPLLAIMSGILSLCVYASKMDKYLVFIPGAVMHGFTLGVAFIITANQLNFLLGLPKLQRHPEFLANMSETFTNLGSASPTAIVFFLATFYALFNLVSRYGKIPWAVILAVIGIIIGFAADGSNFKIQTIRTRYGDLSIQLIQWLDFSVAPPLSNPETLVDLFGGAVSICAVAVLETLISARIADRMTKTVFNQPQEVLSVGVCNIISGMTGGIPATAALARTALNVKSGATSRGAGIVNAITIMLLCSVLFSSFKYLPLPVVATILVNTAYRMVEWHEVHILWETDKPMFVVMVVTATICAVEDPTMGIIYGTGFSMIRILLALMHGHSHLCIYAGSRVELSHEFKLNNGFESVQEVRRKYLKEKDPEDVKKEKVRLAKAEAVSSSSNAIIAAASALRVAEDDARVTALALSSAAGGKALKRAAAKVSAELEELGVDGSKLNGEEEEEEVIYFKGLAPEVGDHRLPKVAVYSLPGYCTYVGAKSHLDRVRGLFVESTCIPGITVMAFDLTDVKYADPDALEVIGDVADEMSREKKNVFLLGATRRLRNQISHLPWNGLIVHFDDYPSLLKNMREALNLDDSRLAQSSPDGTAPSLAEMVVSRVREITTAALTVPSSVRLSLGTPRPGEVGPSSPKETTTPNAGVGARQSLSSSNLGVGATATASINPAPSTGGALTQDEWR